MDRTTYFCLSFSERREDIIFLRMWEGALKCLFRFLLRSEVTKGMNFILAGGVSVMATEGNRGIVSLLKETKRSPWWFNGWKLELSLPRSQVQSLVGISDPTSLVLCSPTPPSKKKDFRAILTKCNLWTLFGS